MTFFSNFESSDWTTFVIAVLAFFVSIGSIIQNALFRPRPHISFEWEQMGAMENVNGVMHAIFRFWNDGDATAHNVRLYVEVDGVVNALESPYWDRWTKVEPGADRIGMEIPVEPCTHGWVGLGERDSYFPSGGPERYSVRSSLLRPTILIRYRGRLRAVRSKAPELSGTPLTGC